PLYPLFFNDPHLIAIYTLSLHDALPISKATKGYTNNNDRMKGKHYKITNKGINFLRDNGYDLSYSAEDLKVSDLRVPTELTFNNLYFDFSSQSWGVIGSRETKKKYGINRGENLNGDH